MAENVGALELVQRLSDADLATLRATAELAYTAPLNRRPAPADTHRAVQTEGGDWQHDEDSGTQTATSTHGRLIISLSIGIGSCSC